MPSAPFRDRTDAGEQLGRALLAYLDERPLVLAMPRGGVPVGFEVAKALGAELDILVVRKLGVPWHPELGFGAIARGSESIDQDLVNELHLTSDELDRVRRRETAELERRERAYRRGRPMPNLEGRTVIVVDDGVATGGTARAALKAVRGAGAAHVVFAAPVGPPGSAARLDAYADEVVILRKPADFQAVGAWYDDFEQTTDEEVLSILDRAQGLGSRAAAAVPKEVAIPVPEGIVSGTLSVPEHAMGLVIFAHGSGSSRFSPRNQYVARVLQERGLATLLMDLLTPEEDEIDERTREYRFDIPRLARRLVRITEWASRTPPTAGLRIGYIGSSTGAGAALIAAAELRDDIAAVVSRGGRPDLAGDALPLVQAPTLMIVGGLDDIVIDLNEQARERMSIPAELRIVPDATHLFEEPGALEEAAGLAAEFLARHVGPARMRGSQLAR